MVRSSDLHRVHTQDGAPVYTPVTLDEMLREKPPEALRPSHRSPSLVGYHSRSWWGRRSEPWTAGGDTSLAAVLKVSTHTARVHGVHDARNPRSLGRHSHEFSLN